MNVRLTFGCEKPHHAFHPPGSLTFNKIVLQEMITKFQRAFSKSYSGIQKLFNINIYTESMLVNETRSVLNKEKTIFKLDNILNNCTL